MAALSLSLSLFQSYSYKTLWIRGTSSQVKVFALLHVCSFSRMLVAITSNNNIAGAIIQKRHEALRPYLRGAQKSKKNKNNMERY